MMKSDKAFPTGWTLKKLGDLGVFLKGKGILKEELSATGLPCIRYGEIYTTHNLTIKCFQSFISRKVAMESERIFHNDILFAGSGETLEEIGKAVAYVGYEEAYAGGDVVILRTNKNTHAEYLSYALNTDVANRQKRRLGQGHSVVHIYGRDLAELRLPLPPLPEQRKIALILSTWDRAIEKNEELIAQKQQLRKGLMQQLLTGKVRFKEFVKSTKMKKTKLGLVPEDWTVVDVNHLTLDHKQGYYTNDPYTKHGRYLLLRGTDMLNPTIDLKTTPRIDASQNDYELFKAEVGDILIVRSGGIGRYGIVKEPLLGIFGSYLIRFRLDNKLILNDFFGLFYQSFISLNQLKSITQGSSNININAENIKSLKVPLPSIEEQKSILVLLLSLEKKISMNNTLLLNLKRQKHGLMQQLLTGKVRVKI